MNEADHFKVELSGAGKKFFRNWIFKNLSFQFSTPQKISILGKNGSGKSTLLQVIAGYESLAEGSLNYYVGGKVIPREDVFRHISIASPYLELVEEYTLEEMVNFHFKFKKPFGNLSLEQIIDRIQLAGSRKKIIKYYSSGMKQRTRLALAMMSDVQLVLLDEPLSNLDKDGERWYADMANEYLKSKSVIVCSNQNESEYFFCDSSIQIADYAVI